MASLARVLRLLAPLLALVSSPGVCLEPYEEELHSLLSPSLRHYSTLHPHTLTHTLHGSQSQPHHSRLVEFHALERHFQLYLSPKPRLFSSGFKVQSIDGRGNLQEHNFDRLQYYHGHLGGEEGSIVNAHILDTGIMTASVVTATETYHFEPSDNFLRRPHPLHMIAYRSSDVKRERLAGTRVDFVVAPPLPPEVQKETMRDRGDHQRAKRQSLRGKIGGSSCSMFLVADFRFFDKFGGGSRNRNETVAGITRRLITLVSDVDSLIYRPTEWVVDTVDDTVPGLGLEIASVLIHTEPSSGSLFTDPQTYYNSRTCCSPKLEANSLLSAFNYGPWEEVCLAHLFTFVNFESGLLGLANIASSFQSQTGGICSEGFTDSSTQQRIVYNTGLSSFTSGGIPIIRDEQILVVGHEVGHNWGSHHDSSEEQDCEGNFLMNEFAQDGSQASHREFSLCSRMRIGEVLRSKASCFIDPDDCGDYIIDVATDERCDEGPTGGACCTDQCTLKPGAACSDTNFACCFECRIVSSTEMVVCDAAGNFSTDCRTDIVCDGADVACPDINTANMAPSGTSCLLGRCREIENDANRTECVDFCTFNNMERCTCTQQDDECKLCCRQGDGLCKPSGEEVNLPTGTRCSIGSCIGGKCREAQDTISRLIFIITNLDGNDFVMFMEENIVGFTLIFTLILWIPSAILIHFCYDHKVWQKFKKENIDFILALKPDKEPLLGDERGELGSRSTSPIDDTPFPYFSPPPTRLDTLVEEDEEEEDDDEMVPRATDDSNSVTLV